MSTDFRRVEAVDLHRALAGVVEERLVRELAAKAPGHCMKVQDLDREVMEDVGTRLRAKLGDSAQVHVLCGERSDNPLFITSTKLVELRNPNADGRQRAPLLVFVPGDLKASAEDSFGEATFAALPLHEVYEALVEQLQADLPNGLRSAVPEIFRLLQGAEWRWADAQARVRYLLSLRINGYDHEVAGASLYELGLVPDLRLLDDPEQMRGRLARNADCMRILTLAPKTERTRVLDLRLASRAFESRLAGVVCALGLDEPTVWPAQLILDPSRRDLTFDKWEFQDGDAAAIKVCVRITSLDIPELKGAEEGVELPRQLFNQRVLLIGPGGTKSFKVKFACEPHPQQLAVLDHFRLQIVARDGSSIGVTKKKERWDGGKAEKGVTFSNLAKHDWEEGWYRVRVAAYTAAGEALPLVDDHGQPVDGPPAGSQEGTKRFNESDDFYVLKREDLSGVESEQRHAPKHPSVAHAKIALQFKALSESRDPSREGATRVAWVEPQSSSNLRSVSLIEARFAREGVVHVPVANVLRIIEQRILKSPDSPLSWKLTITAGQPEEPCDGVAGWPKLEVAEEFQTARAAFARAVRGESGELVMVASDLGLLQESAATYAQTYLSLLRQLLRRIETSSEHERGGWMKELQKMLLLDTVEVTLRDPRGPQRQALLVGPTHPLRAVWLATWAKLGEFWLESAARGPKEFLTPTRDSLLARATLLGFPSAMPVGPGKIFTAVDNIHPYWTLYSAAEEPDPRGLVGEVCTGLGISEPSQSGFFFSGAYLAERIRRYVIQHPYVHTLTLNCFNVGRGKALADMLLELQRTTGFDTLRYDLRVFAKDPEQPGLVGDVQELIDPSSPITAVEADAFAQAAGTHLAPKLAVSVRAEDEYRRAPQEFSAHLSVLFDAFPALETAAEEVDSQEDRAPIHGLLQDFSVTFSENDECVSWKRTARHGVPLPIPGSEELVELLGKLTVACSGAAATVATQQPAGTRRTVTRLVLSAEDKALLHQIHEYSDWVFTVDRSVGVEFFDNAHSPRRPEYLIDHSPETASSAGRRVVITSRSLTEIETLFASALESYGLAEFRDRAAALLGELRCLSGRLALKLLSVPNQQAEALGLAMAKTYLESIGALRNQLVVSLDAHQELFRSAALARRDAEEAVSLQRTDLALFDINARDRLITCRLVEVKCYRATGSLENYRKLKQTIAEQLAQSEAALRHHYDPERGGANDRPDRIVKTHELAEWLEFYVARAARLGLLSEEARQEARYAVRDLEKGYRLRFTRSAIVFDFSHNGCDQPTDEEGIEYHRIGRDTIVDLIASLTAKGRHEVTQDLPGTPRVCSRISGTTTFTVPEKAALLPTKRDRTVTWETPTAMPAPELPADDPKGNTAAKGSSPAPVPECRREVPVQPPVIPTVPRPPVAEVHVGQTNGVDETKDSRSVPGALTIPNLPAVAAPDVVLGVTAGSPQFGVIGKTYGRTVALDLNQTHTISLFGVQGGGKSYTLGSIIEMGLVPIPGINALPAPLGAVVFHYSQTQDYKPEFTSMISPNDEGWALAKLLADYGAKPRGLGEVVLLTPADKVSIRKAEYPGIRVLPLKFASSELKAEHWRFLMGAVGNQAAYIRQLSLLMRARRNNLTLEGLRADIEACDMSDAQKRMARTRLDFVDGYIDDARELGGVLEPGSLVIVDLRDEFIEKEEALGLFVVLLQLFSESTYAGQRFNKLIVFDEAHKYVDNEDLIDSLTGTIREMRHFGTSVLVASQDPVHVPPALIELSSQIILHRFNSPLWLKHIQKCNASLAGLSSEHLARLGPGEAYVWSGKASDTLFSGEAVKVQIRPRVTKHGGGTKTALS